MANRLLATRKSWASAFANFDQTSQLTLLADTTTKAPPTSGNISSIGTGPGSWSIKQQSTVFLSICEAEYIGQTLMNKKAVWLQNLLAELADMNERQLHTVAICGDSHGAIALARNPKFHGRSNNVNIEHHYVRVRVMMGRWG